MNAGLLRRAAVIAALLSLCSLALLAPVALGDSPAPFNSCNASDLPAPALDPQDDTIIVDGQMQAAGEEANYVADNSSGGFANSKTSVTFRSVPAPWTARTATNPSGSPVDYSGNGSTFYYYKESDSTAKAWLSASYQVQYWNGNNYNFYYTAASSDLHKTKIPGTSSYYPLFVDKCAGDAALRMGHSRGLYLHEVVADLVGPNWDWAAGVKALQQPDYNLAGQQLSESRWQVLDYWVSLAKRLNKKVIWSEPAQGWYALAHDQTAAAYFSKWGDTLVPMFATNFDTPTSGRLMGGSAQWAANVATDFGMELGESVQSWYFREQTDLPGQASTGLPTANAFGTGLRQDTTQSSSTPNPGTCCDLDPVNTNAYEWDGVAGDPSYGNPLTSPKTLTNAEPSLQPTAAATKQLAEFGGSVGATYFQVEGTMTGYQVAGQGSYAPVEDMGWPLGGTPSTYLQGIEQFSAGDLANGPITTSTVDTVPLYQLWDSTHTSHFYTTKWNPDAPANDGTGNTGGPEDPNGVAVPLCDPPPGYTGTFSPSTVNSKYCYQEITGWVAPLTSSGTPAPAGTVPLYEYYNGNYGFFYTTANSGPSGYSKVAPIANVPSTQVPGTEPWYDMFADGSATGGYKDYFYTTDAAWERANALGSWIDYHDKGVAAWLYSYGPTPTLDPTPGPTGADEMVGGDNPSEANCNCDGDTGSYTEGNTDIAVPGRGLPLSLSRTYDSVSAVEGWHGRFGYGWHDSYDMAVNSEGGGIVAVRQENGSVVRFSDDNNDNVWTAPARVFATLVHNADSSWTFTRDKKVTYTFDSAGKLVSEKDLDGNTTTLSYDAAGNLTTITDPGGRTITLSYTNGQVTQATNPAGRSYTYAYDGSGSLTQVTDLDGAVTTYGYDASHRLTSITLPMGGVTSVAYDGTSGREASEKDPLGNTTSWTYDITSTTTNGTTATHVVVLGTDPEGRQTKETYINGELSERITGYGTSAASVVTFAYDDSASGSGQPTSITDGNGHTTSFTYDARGNLLTKTDPLGNKTTWTYNNYNEVTSETLPATYGGQTVTTTYTYDESAYSSGGAGNLTTVSTPILGSSGTQLGTQTTHLTYGSSTHPDDLTARQDPRNNVWTFSYDQYGDRVKETAPATSDNSESTGSRQNVTRWAYNTKIGEVIARLSGRYMLANPTAASCTTTATAPAAGCTNYVYDSFGRLTSVTDGLGHVATTQYDADGNVKSQTDADGNKTTFAYDIADNLATTTRPDGSVEKVDYWPSGLMKDQVDASNATTKYTYDPLGRVASTTDADGRVRSFSYDRSGNLVTVADPAASGSGSVDCSGAVSPRPAGCTTETYDADNRRTGIRYYDGKTHDVTYTYDANGRRTAMTDATGTSNWYYNSLNLTTSVIDGTRATTGYGRDSLGNVTSITYPGGKGTVSRTFDAAGRISAIKDWSGNSTTFAYDADGNLTSTTDPVVGGTPVTDSVSLDGADHITGIDTAKGSTTLATFDYARNKEDQLKSVTSTGVPSDNHTYTYNSLHQLQTVDGKSLSYDAADRPTGLADGTTQTFDPAGQLTQVTNGNGSANFTYDVRGNRTSGGAPGQPSSTYTYDESNNLATATPNGGSTTYAYTYNGDGLRMAKTPSGGSTEQFRWDTASGPYPLLLEDDSTTYLYGPDGAPLERMDGSGNLVWYHHDQEGSTRVLTDATGAVVGTASYDAYGKTSGTTGVTSRLGYEGQYTDPETGFVYLRARYYDPSTAQFLTVDPMVASSNSAYGYAGDDPLDNVDPLGLQWFIYVLTHNGIPYYVGRTQDINARIAAHIKNGRFEKGNGFNYEVVGKDIDDVKTARGVEQLVIEDMGTLKTVKKEHILNNNRLLKNQRNEIGKKNPGREKMIESGEKFLEDHQEGEVKLGNMRRALEQSNSPEAKSDRAALKAEPNDVYDEGRSVEMEPISEPDGD